jgi:hypothetical protein
MRGAAICVLLCACNELPGPPQPGQVSLAVTSPSAGAELDGAEAAMITVTGTVATTNSAYGTLRAWVDGVAVELDDSGAFTAQVAPVVGINHIAVDATDGLAEPIRKELDVLWAPAFLPTVAGTTGFEVPDGLDLYLGQQFFDARRFGTTLDLSTDPVVAHDLASALELILWNIDLASLLPGGLHVGTGNAALDVAIPSATPTQILVDARIVDAPDPAIDLSMDLNGVFLATTGSFQYGNTTLQVAGGLSADMHASARLTLGVSGDGAISVGVTDVTAIVGPLVPMFTGPDADTLDGFIAVGNNDFRLLVENLIKQQLIPTFTDRIPPLLESLLGATDKLLDNVTLTLDAKLGTPVTLSLDGKLDMLAVVPGPAIGEAPGHVTVRQRVAIATTGAPVHPGSRGAARTSAQPALPPTNTAALQLLLSHDFLNALLHALWNGGLLEGTTTVGGTTANVSAKLQPVVIPLPDDVACEIDGVRCDVLLELGQVEVELPDFAQRFAIDARAGARVVVDGTTVSLVIQDAPDVTVWEISEVPGRLSTEALRELVVNAVWPTLFGAIGDQLHITLPLPDLAALGLSQLSPNLANAKLELAVRPHAAVSDGFLGLGADLQLATPHP